MDGYGNGHSICYWSRILILCFPGKKATLINVHVYLIKLDVEKKLMFTAIYVNFIEVNDLS